MLLSQNEKQSLILGMLKSHPCVCILFQVSDKYTSQVLVIKKQEVFNPLKSATVF